MSKNNGISMEDRASKAKEQQIKFSNLNDLLLNELKSIVNERGLDEDLLKKMVYANNIAIVYLQILSWLETAEGSEVNETLCERGKKIVEVDMNKVVAINDNLNDYISDIINEMIAVSKSDSESGSYIYVAHRNDGMVTVVGESSFERKNGIVNKCGDLFYELNTNSLVGTENIILRTECECQIDSILKNYYSKSWVIPISDKLNKGARFYEKKLGNYLRKSGIPILNYYSHEINNNS